jgi:hypothetical protein
MAHMLARLRGIRLEDIAAVLKADAPHHAREGLYLEHLWQNDDDSGEILFLFRVDDLKHARQFIDKVHSQALRENPAASLPVMTYLRETPG